MNDLKTIDPKSLSLPELHAYLISAVAPRPIAFASTMNDSGSVNLSPFSFFNVFSSNPPIMIFSASRRGRDNTTKDTLENVQKRPEVVINVVNYAIVEQMSLASAEYPQGVNEFTKSGLTEVPSLKVAPPRVAESPVSFECKVNKIIPLGNKGGAGNLIICEVLLMHINTNCLDDAGKINPEKMDVVARMGGNWYCRANMQSMFEIAKPSSKVGMGIDGLPHHIRDSELLSGNELGKLGHIEKLPSPEEVQLVYDMLEVKSLLKYEKDKKSRNTTLIRMAKEKLAAENLELAIRLLMAAG